MESLSNYYYYYLKKRLIKKITKIKCKIAAANDYYGFKPKAKRFFTGKSMIIMRLTWSPTSVRHNHSRTDAQEPIKAAAWLSLLSTSISFRFLCLLLLHRGFHVRPCWCFFSCLRGRL